MSGAPDPTPDTETPKESPPRRPDLSLIGYIEESREPEGEAREGD